MGLRVLLVEDDEDNRELMVEILADSGFEVVPASSGPEGLEKLSGKAVDVVVTDVGMPGMGGLEMARAARAIAPDVPVILVTGWTDRQDIAEAHGREVDAVLVKPVEPDVLIRAIAEVARGHGRP